jgi:hypothetical protein
VTVVHQRRSRTVDPIETYSSHSQLPMLSIIQCSWGSWTSLIVKLEFSNALPFTFPVDFQLAGEAVGKSVGEAASRSDLQWAWPLVLAAATSFVSHGIKNTCMISWSKLERLAKDEGCIRSGSALLHALKTWNAREVTSHHRQAVKHAKSELAVDSSVVKLTKSKEKEIPPWRPLTATPQRIPSS